MGTNYYFLKPVPRRGRTDDVRRLHIGKSSVGWCFALCVHPDEGIRDLADWEKLWASGGEIVDEYDRPVSIDLMKRTITQRSWARAPTEEELRRNHAILGPNNLMRHTGYGAVLGPEGATWDLCVGDFS